MAKRITEEMMIKTDGQRIGEDSDYWVYLTKLKAYNEGILLGTHLHFPFDRDELNQAFQQICVGASLLMNLVIRMKNILYQDLMLLF